MAYDGSIEVISGFKPRNDGDFTLATARHIYIDDDTRLSDYINQQNINQVMTNTKITEAKHGSFYTIFGTQTSGTNNLSGRIQLEELYDGLMVMYILPYDASGDFTLNLLYNNGMSSTGPVSIYNGKDTVLSGSLDALSVLPLIYYSKGSISINGTQTTQDRWLCITSLIGWND